MRHDYLDRYSRADSPVHRLPAAVKMAAALLFLLVAATLPASRATLLAGMALLLLAIAGISRIPFGFLVRRLLLLEPLVIGISLLSILQPDGWRAFAFLMGRSNVCLLVMILLTSTTPFPAILQVLTRMRVPRIFVTIMALLYRYLFVLVDETERMRRARKSRTFSTSRSRQWRVLADMIGQLFVRSAERADRIFLAMRARGWQ